MSAALSNFGTRLPPSPPATKLRAHRPAPTEFERLLRAKQVAVQEHERYLNKKGLLAHHKANCENERRTARVLGHSRSAPTLHRPQARASRARTQATVNISDVSRTAFQQWFPQGPSAADITTTPTTSRTAEMPRPTAGLRPPAHRFPPPNECMFTVLVSRQLDGIKGTRDPLGDRLPFNAHYRAHLSAAKQRRLLALVAASVPRCAERDAAQRAHDGVAIDADVQELQQELAERERASRQNVDIDVRRLETRIEAERRMKTCGPYALL